MFHARALAQRAGLSVDRWPARGSLEALVRDVIVAKQIDCVLDVGANEGQFSSTLRRLGYDGQIVSFEPVEAAFSAVGELAAKDSRWDVRNVAVGAEPGVAEINVAGSTAVSSFLEFNTATADGYGEDAAAVYEQTTAQHRQAVNVVTLDSVDLPGARILLKTDTQGFDMEVLEGASGLLSSGRVCAVLSEISFVPLYHGMRNRLPAMTEYLEPFGFELSGLFPLSRDSHFRQVEMDGVFVHTGGPTSSPQ